MRLEKRYGRLRVTDKIIRDTKGYNHKVVCVCSCGTEKAFYISNLRRGVTKSCGCFGIEATKAANTTHGLAGTPIYKVWVEMKRRCNNPKNLNYEKYGGRGIKVCERWQKFENFYKDMGERPERLSIDRTDNDGDYEPGNCRWATPKEQANNTRSNQLYKIFIDGEWQEKNVSQWANQFNLKPSTVYTRLFRGWTITQALLLPAHYAGLE